MAHLSGDETYLNAFNSGQDPHLAIAATKYHIPYEEALKIYDDENHPDHKIWKVRRKQAKQIAFGLIYGIGAKLLQNRCGRAQEICKAENPAVRHLEGEHTVRCHFAEGGKA